jgi:hypothetical protein
LICPPGNTKASTCVELASEARPSTLTLLPKRFLFQPLISSGGLSPATSSVFRLRHPNFYLTAGYISQLERGAKHPKGLALTLLNVIRRKGFEAVL